MHWGFAKLSINNLSKNKVHVFKNKLVESGLGKEGNDHRLANKGR